MTCERCKRLQAENERLMRERDEARIDAEACRQSQQAHQFALSAEREAHAQLKAELPDAILNAAGCSRAASTCYELLGLEVGQRIEREMEDRNQRLRDAEADAAALRAETERLSARLSESEHACAFYRRTGDEFMRERDTLSADIAAWPVCANHKPGKWDGGPRCVVCEAHAEHAVLEGIEAWLDDSLDATRRKVACLQSKGLGCEASDLNQRITGVMSVTEQIAALKRQHGIGGNDGER